MGAVASDDGDQAGCRRNGLLRDGDCGSVDMIRRRCGRRIGKAVANENSESDFVNDHRDPIGWANE
jgi:hypothetical protein